MRAYVKSHIEAHSIQRISAALAKYAPSDITIVDKPSNADIIVHLIVGVGNFSDIPIDKLIETELQNGQQYAIVQCCLMSTEISQSDFWRPLWENAEIVWSYLNLKTFAPTYDFNFYHAPLGVESIFHKLNESKRDITMLTTGFVAESECVREASEAVRRVGGKHMHVGVDFNLGSHSENVIWITDSEMANLYSRSKFVAGLRRDEGFELPAAEGLLCGARPIMFDAPHYRQWFNPWAMFIPEDNSSVVTGSIESILKHSFDVSTEEITDASTVFNWSTIISGFWSSILSRKPQFEVV